MNEAVNSAKQRESTLPNIQNIYATAETTLMRPVHKIAVSPNTIHKIYLQ